MYGFTHAAFALALCYLLRLPVVTGVLAGLLPDMDVLVPFLEHRGMLHTPLAAGFFGMLLFAASDSRSTAEGFAVGYLSHLFIDAFTYTGIMWFYPWEVHLSWRLVEAASPAVNLGIAGVSLVLFQTFRIRSRWSGWTRMLNGLLR